MRPTHTLIFLAMAACSGSSAPSTMLSPPTVDAGKEPPPTGTGDAGTNEELTDTAAPTIAVERDVTLPDHPHTLDIYGPSNAERVVIFLHGGLGRKETSAPAIGVTNEAGDPDAAWLLAKKTAFVFPQGGAIMSSPLATTWSNYVMRSGRDDVAFLEALAARLRAGTVSPKLPGVGRVYVAGHSNGGMMANRLWCESASFDAYGALAGPASVALHPPGGAHPCTPSTVKPYLGVVGTADTVLQTTNNWSEPVWTISSILSSGPSFEDPNLVNEEIFHRSIRVPRACGGEPRPPTVSGKTVKYSDCDGRMELLRIDGANHCVRAGGTCEKSLESESGLVMRDVLVDFFVRRE